MKSAAALSISTDGATGQPLRANPVSEQDSMLRAVRGEDAMCADVPPDEPLDHELRYEGVWRAHLSAPQELVPQPFARPLP